MKCKEENVESHYIEETSRTTFERFLEHRGQIHKENPDSPMVEHFQEHHKETKPGLEHFKLEVLKRFAKCLERQIFEGYRIRNYKGEKIMNRRGDWGQNLPPQFSIEREKEAPPRKKTGRSGGPPTTGKGPTRHKQPGKRQSRTRWRRPCPSNCWQ